MTASEPKPAERCETCGAPAVYRLDVGRPYRIRCLCREHVGVLTVWHQTIPSSSAAETKADITLRGQQDESPGLAHETARPGSTGGKGSGDASAPRRVPGSKASGVPAGLRDETLPPSEQSAAENPECEACQESDKDEENQHAVLYDRLPNDRHAHHELIDRLRSVLQDREGYIAEADGDRIALRAELQELLDRDDLDGWVSLSASAEDRIEAVLIITKFEVKEVKP